MLAVSLVGAALLTPASGATTSSSGGPTLVLNPASGVVGMAVKATGTNFPSRTRGKLVFGTTAVAGFKTGPRGGFSLSFDVPAGYSGSNTVVASTGSVSAATLLTIADDSTGPTVTSLPPTGSDAFGPASGRPFAASSAWNVPIAANPGIDPNSTVTVSYLASAAHPGIADLYAYGVPVWDADASTPRYSIVCSKPWGVCQLSLAPVPIPDNAAPSSGTDGAMVVIDWSSGKAYEFYGAVKSAGVWTAKWGGIVDIAESGTPGQAVGAGISRLAGVVRAFEIDQGRIDHALVFSTNNACPSIYRYPAAKTDGRSSRSDCVQEGARLQLDPSINVDALPGVTPAERMVAKALQTYGAYVIDNGGANMAFVFETPSGESDPYCSVGLCHDYQGLDHIPWSKLRVLSTWSGT